MEKNKEIQINYHKYKKKSLKGNGAVADID